jgi:hypothetical protein
MPRTEKYFIGPQLLGDIRRVIGRVEAEPIASEISRIPTRLQDMRRGGGGGGTSLRLGRVTAAWSKSSLADVVEYNSGPALSEEFSAPPSIIEGCVNKMANVEAGAWVIVGQANGRWYLVSAECEVEPPTE